MRIQFKTLGCRLNEAELETWAHKFQASGYSIVDKSENADVLIFNSCGVTQDAVRKSRNLIRKATRDNPDARVVVTGCYATLNPEQAAELGVDMVISNTEKERLVELVQERVGPFTATKPVDSPEIPETSALFKLGRHRAFIKVQDGCRHRCTYCIVTIARGQEHSREPADIIDEINRVHSEGIQEAVLTGVHLGGYGSDIESNLTALITTLLENTHIPRIRLGSLEPWDIPSQFLDVFNNPRVMPHLHLPLQSGSDNVLKRMARRCKAAEFKSLVTQLREQVPLINITTDLIAGFPGETEVEWNETLRLVEELAFGDIHVFSFSPRTGTAAASMPNTVPADIRKSRCQELQQLADRQKQIFARQHIGKILPVLWEGERRQDDGSTMIFGYTPNYVRIGLRTDHCAGEKLSYTITDTLITELAENEAFLYGRLLN